MQSTARKISGHQSADWSRTCLSVGAERKRNIQKKEKKEVIHRFRPISLAGLNKVIKTKTLMDILSKTENESIYGPNGKTEQILLDIYPIIKDWFDKNNIVFNLKKNEDPNKVMKMIIRKIDKLYPDWEWSIKRSSSNEPYYIDVFRSYDSKVPVYGYSFEMKPIFDIRNKQKLLFEGWLMIVSIVRKYLKADCWFDAITHEHCLESLRNVLEDPAAYQFDQPTMKEYENEIQRYESGDAYVFQEMIKRSNYTLLDLVKYRDKIFREKKMLFKKEMIALCNHTINCCQDGRKITEMINLGIAPYGSNIENIMTINEYMQIHWSYDDHYWRELECHHQFCWENSDATIGFSDHFVLTKENSTEPDIDPFPGLIKAFFNFAWRLQEKIEKHFSNEK